MNSIFQCAHPNSLEGYLHTLKMCEFALIIQPWVAGERVQKTTETALVLLQLIIYIIAYFVTPLTI